MSKSSTHIPFFRASTLLLGGPGASIQRRLLCAVMLGSATLAGGAVVSNWALGLGWLMTAFSLLLCLTSFGMWAAGRFSRWPTDLLASLSVLVGLVLLSGAWLLFEGGMGMSPPLLFWLLSLPLMFRHSRAQVTSLGIIVVFGASLSWIDLAHPEFLPPYYETDLDRKLDVVVSRVLSLLCCGILLLRGKWLYSAAIDRLHAAEVQRLQMVEQQIRLEAERRTQELEKARSMSRGFAHDLSNLLTVVQTHAELLSEEMEQGAVDPTQAREDLEGIRTSARAAVQLSRRLLQTRPSADHIESIEVGAFLQAQVAMADRLAPGVSVELTRCGTEVWARGRVVMLEQALLNLCLNAIQAMEGAGRIEVRCASTESAVHIEVHDSGPGIPPEVLPRIFELHFTTRREEGGTGLGLAMVREGLERDGGRIGVESTLGRGTCFRITLPREAPPPSAG